MADALIGSTGFVGGNLARQHRFDASFHSTNIEELPNGSYDLIVCAGMPAAKWLANRDPETDRRCLDKLTVSLLRTAAQRVVLISTIDVYPSPVSVDESTPISKEGLHAYGKHRLMLEEAVRAQFPSTLVVRLPAMFGPGLKKNAVYDLLHNNDTHKIHSESRFQFYDVTELWLDIEQATALEIPLLNLATEPVSMAEVAREAFGMEFANRTESPPASYDMRTLHAAEFEGTNGYLRTRTEVLDRMRQFVDAERRAGAAERRAGEK